MKYISYAQNFEDVVLMRALKHVRGGCYVDVGAQHPVIDSVTKAFYERGWRGINIEPIPRWFEMLCNDRPEDINIRAAVSDVEGRAKIFDVEGSGLSTLDADFAGMHEAAGHKITEIEVDTVPLGVLLKRHAVGEINFLKIDVEGAEKAVISGVDLNEIRPWIILVEATQPNSSIPTYAEWESLVISSGYQMVYDDGLNRFYLAEEHGDLAPAFSRPPNVLDGFERYAEWATRNHAVMLTNQLEDARRQIDVAAAYTRAQRLEDELEAVRRESALRSELLEVGLEAARREFAFRNELLEGELEAARRGLAAAQERENSRVEQGNVLLASVRHLEDEISNAAEREAAAHERTATMSEAMGRLQAELEQMAQLAKNTSAERELALIESNRLGQVIAAMESSRSWRVTKPLRFAGKSVRMVRRRLGMMLRPVWHLVVRYRLAQRAAVMLTTPSRRWRERIEASIAVHTSPPAADRKLAVDEQVEAQVPMGRSAASMHQILIDCVSRVQEGNRRA